MEPASDENQIPKVETILTMEPTKALINSLLTTCYYKIFVSDTFAVQYLSRYLSRYFSPRYGIVYIHIFGF